MTLYTKNGRARFSESKTLIHKLICVKNNFYPASIKKDNGGRRNEKKLRCKRNQQLHRLKKVKHR